MKFSKAMCWDLHLTFVTPTRVYDGMVLLRSNCGNTRERSGALPYQLVEAKEKEAFG